MWGASRWNGWSPQPGSSATRAMPCAWSLDVATTTVAVVLMDGDLGGRLAWGAMRVAGPVGPAGADVLLAAGSGCGEAAAAIQRMLDASNARYRAAFMLRPVAHAAATIHVLESAGATSGWMPWRARTGPPMWWSMAGCWPRAIWPPCRRSAQRRRYRGRRRGPRRIPARRRAGWIWSAAARWPGTPSPRGRMAQVFSTGGSSQAAREQLNEAKAWIDAFAPFGEARWSLARRAGETALAVDLGLSGAGALDRMPAP
jgi:hypothetical protein